MTDPKLNSGQEFTVRNAANLYEGLIAYLATNKNATPYASLLAIAMIAGDAINILSKRPGRTKIEVTQRFMEALAKLGGAPIAYVETVKHTNINNN